MLINVFVGAKETPSPFQGLMVCEKTSVRMEFTELHEEKTTLHLSEQLHPGHQRPASAPERTPPPPPPLPNHGFNGLLGHPPPPPPPPLHPGAPLAPAVVVHRSKLKSFYWDAIPSNKITGRSVWNLSSEDEDDFQLDTRTIEELFGQKENNTLRRQSSRHSLRVSSPLVHDSDKVLLLDAKRSMNMGIFLKQFRRSVHEIIKDLKQGAGEHYGAEKLSELLKLLPEADEVKHFRMFEGDPNKLEETDLFVFLLLQLPSYRLRIEILVLKMEFYPLAVSVLQAVCTLRHAAEELLDCSELHATLRLVLKTGNYMNAGSYAGNAAGFRIASLLKLADTKANKPGMNLLHFVAMEVQKNNQNLLSFPEKLEHVGAAARLCEDSVLEDFLVLRQRVASTQSALEDEEELQDQMSEFLMEAERKLNELHQEVVALKTSRKTLLEFFCEDEATFKLEEVCKVFKTFSEKFIAAVQENQHRETAEQKRKKQAVEQAEKQNSTSACISDEAELEQDELALILERNLRNAGSKRSGRRSKSRSLGITFSCPTVPVMVSSSEKSAPIKFQEEVADEFNDFVSAVHLSEVSKKVLSQQLGYPIAHEQRNQTSDLKEPTKPIMDTTESSSKKPQQPVSQHSEFLKVGETVECRTLVKGLKSYENIAGKKTSPCLRWRRVQLKENDGTEHVNRLQDVGRHCNGEVGTLVEEKRVHCVSSSPQQNDIAILRLRDEKSNVYDKGATVKRTISQQRDSPTSIPVPQRHKGLKSFSPVTGEPLSPRNIKPLFSTAGLNSVQRKPNTVASQDSKRPLSLKEKKSLSAGSESKPHENIMRPKPVKTEPDIRKDLSSPQKNLGLPKKIFSRDSTMTGCSSRSAPASGLVGAMHSKTSQNSSNHKPRSPISPVVKTVKQGDPVTPSQKTASSKLTKVVKSETLPVWR